MINALGLLEVYGFVAGVEAMDAMLKSANVRLLSHSVTPSALVTIVVEGDLAACRAALDAGSAAAERIGGKVICRKDLGRPEADTERMVLSFCNGMQGNLEPSIEKIVEEAVSDEVIAEAPTLIEVISVFLREKAEKGAILSEISKHVEQDIEGVKQVIQHGLQQKILRKNSNRYYIIEDKL